MEEDIYAHDILKSGIQKYIRRSNKKKALLCLAKLLHSNNKYWYNVVRRIAVIACEDISIANVSAVYYLMRRVIEITQIKLDHTAFSFREKYNMLAPLVSILSECEKCRITDHLYHGVYSSVDKTPTLSLDECIMSSSDGVIYYYNFGDKNEVIDKLRAKNNTSKMNDFYDTCDTIGKRVREGFLMYYMYILVSIYGLSFEKSEMDTDITEYTFTGTEVFEIDDYVIDKHTRLGKLRGKNLMDFITTGSVVYPESSLTNTGYKKLYDQTLIMRHMATNKL